MRVREISDTGSIAGLMGPTSFSPYMGIGV